MRIWGGNYLICMVVIEKYYNNKTPKKKRKKKCIYKINKTETFEHIMYTLTSCIFGGYLYNFGMKHREVTR